MILTKPDNSLISRVLSEVAFEDRLTGYRLREHAGALPRTMYSFEEIVIFLADPYPAIDINELEIWIRKVIQDRELADSIAEVREKGNSDLERLKDIRKLMIVRLNQCKKII